MDRRRKGEEGLAVVSVDGQIENIYELVWETGELWVGVGGGSSQVATSDSTGSTLPTAGTRKAVVGFF